MKTTLLKTLTLLTGLLAACPAHSQEMEWQRSYGGSDYDVARALVATPDGGFALAGYTKSYGVGIQDMWLVKVDARGNKQWSKTYGGSKSDGAYALVATPDGGFALAGYTYDYGAVEGDMWLVKVDAQGEKQWQRTYGGSDDDWSGDLVATPDGGFALAGSTRSYGAGGYDMWLVKVDAQGEKQWQRTYGGSDDDWSGDLVATPDGGFALAGYTNSHGAGKEDMWLVKVDARGNQQWQRTYGGSDYDEANALVATPDGGFALAGYTESHGAGGKDMWLVKVEILPLSEQIEKKITARMGTWLEAEQGKLEEWEQKGEFETTSAYQLRMEKRPQKAAALEAAASAQRQKITQEVMAQSKKQHDESIEWSEATLSRYDADNQAFRITVPGLPQPLVVSVPLAQAPKFKEAFTSRTVQFKDKEYVPSDDQWVLVSLSVGSEAAGFHSWKSNN